MIHIKDNFFNDPYLIRNIGLKQEYVSEGFYPGSRSFDIPNIIENYTLSEVKYLLKNNILTCKSAFQYSTKEFKEGLFHSDNSLYTSIVFLSPNPPQKTGLEICEKCDIILEDSDADIKHNFYKNTKNFLNSYRFNLLKNKLNKKFNPIAKIPNNFNRFILFDSSLFHRAQNFFGTSIENSRLTFISFYYI